MKIHLYIAMLWVISLLAGCNDVTVGYLYTTEASYSMDTLQVTRFSALEDNINELESVFEKYTRKFKICWQRPTNWKRNLFHCQAKGMSYMKLISGREQLG